MESETAMQTENRRDPKMLLNKQDLSSGTVIMLKVEIYSFLMKKRSYMFLLEECLCDSRNTCHLA